MFNNWINHHDFYRIAEKLRQGYFSRLLSTINPSKTARVKAAWGKAGGPPKHWESVPAIVAHWNRTITGNENIRHYEYVADKYLLGGNAIRGLSVGCGSGANELRWARTGVFGRIDAFDLSETRIEDAKRKAKAEGLDQIVSFSVADVAKAEIRASQYDVVIAESALHHFTPLRQAVLRLHQALKPGGYLILRDYVGPARFQWTTRQLEIVEETLAALPERYRRRWKSNTIKKQHYRPSRLSMLASDPSEAAESDKTLELLSEMFESKEFAELGGTILHLVLNDIAHNFVDDGEETIDLLEQMIELEHEAIRRGEISSDFVFGVYQKTHGELLHRSEQQR